MRVYYWQKRGGLVSLLLAIALFVAAYVLTSQRLSDARLARREDDCGLAENILAECWRLPGLRTAIELEEALLAVQQGDLRDEKTWHSRAVSRSTERTLIMEALAKGKLATFQWEDAANRVESILDRQPTDARALWIRGRARVEMQQEERARQDFEHALEKEPGSFEIRRSLADLLHKLGHVRTAIEHYQSLCKLRPDDQQVLLALVHCWQEESRHTAARELTDTFLASRPESVAGLVERGRLALRADDPQSAERWLRRAIELNPDNADANFVLRLALQAQNKVDTVLDRHIAQNDLRQAELKSLLRELDYKPDVLTDVGRWMMRTGFDNEVSGWLYSALKEDSDYAPAHIGLAEFFSENGQLRRANWHARQAGIELVKSSQNPDSSQVFKHDVEQMLARECLPDAVPTSEASSEDVHRLCAACHAYPPPETMPRWAWRKEVKQGYDFLRASNLAVDYPSLESVVLYYERRAPERLTPIEQIAATATPLVNFEKRGTGYMPRLPPRPGITNANLARLFGSANKELLLCETRQDALMLLKPYDRGPGGTVIPQVNTPCHTTVCDLDLDGRQDVIVASLGSFFPSDDKMGRVLWLRATSGGHFDAVPILKGVGRVSDIQVADFNGDGQLDLVVAVFGWRTTGEILYLENRTTDWSQPQFVPHVVDARHGAIHVPVVDLNHDKRPDIVALISQQHETVVGYMNQGDGSFQPATIFAAPHPSYGCSGIELVDLDGDRDLDVLLSNGDILDPPYLLKPYHGVQWLENEGTFPFKHHHVAALYGVSRAVAADFDGDGDQDVAAVTFLPSLQFPNREKLRLPSVVLFEQLPKMQFATHILETGTCDHFSCAVGDWDDDGRVDLVVTNFAWSGSQPMQDAAVLWRNVGKQ